MSRHVPTTKVAPDDPRAIAWRKALPLAGRAQFLADRYGITSSAVYLWKVCPPERCLDIEALSGVSRYELRPDVYGDEPSDAAFSKVWDIEAEKGLKEFGIAKLAEALGMSKDDIDAWDEIPATLVLKIERLTGISRHQLRPDVFGDEPERVAAAE